MFTYLMMYFISAFFAISNVGKNVRSSAIVWNVVALGLMIIIGFRHEVGGDWFRYLEGFYYIENFSLYEVLFLSDPGYQLLNYFMSHWGWGIYMVNFFSAILFVSGLIALLRRQMNPWLGLTVAIPYLIIVVSMGYTRQGVAIGLVMWGIASLERRRFMRFVFFVFLAMTFHKSAIVMLGFGIFEHGKGRILKILAVILFLIGAWFAFIEQTATLLWKSYVEADMQSQGAMIRVLLNLVPAILLLYFRKQWTEHFRDYTFWFMISIASIISVGLVSFASTAVDRISLYFIPLQIVLFARLPYLAHRKISQKITTFLIILFYAIVMFVWLFFGSYSMKWLPYYNILFYDLV